MIRRLLRKWKVWRCKHDYLPIETYQRTEWQFVGMGWSQHFTGKFRCRKCANLQLGQGMKIVFDPLKMRDERLLESVEHDL